MLTSISGIGQKTKQKLNDLGVFTPIDLMMTFPQKYINLNDIGDLNDTANGDYCIAEIEIVRVSTPFRRGRLQIFKVQGNAKNKSNCSKKVEIVWFNQNYFSKIIQKGKSYIFYGKHSVDSAGMSILINPTFEDIDTEKSQFIGIQPIYRTKGIVSQKMYRKFVNSALDMGFNLPLIVGKRQEKKHNLMPFFDAVCQLHNPDDFGSIERARYRIKMELLVKRLAAFELAKSKKKPKIIFHKLNSSTLDTITRCIDFELTQSQIDAINKIIDNLIANPQYNSMLCGDVGSGKTIVALAVASFVIENGYQVAIMTPTELLANQHFERAKSMCEQLGIEIVLVTASTEKAVRNKVIDQLRVGKIDLIIGTHSLLNEQLTFSSMGLVVMDEQHKFGVAQRTELMSKGYNCPTLTLTATPIPRSLELIAYGEIELITIEKRFANNVSTFVVGKDKRADMFNYIAKLCEGSNKAIIIAPRIEDSEGIEINSVKRLYKELSSHYFKKLKVGYLHGQLKSEQKNKIISDFFNGKLSVIVATSILEVGIDLPDLSIIAIMDAERFGLATLHQLRGRVGRQGQKAMCFLYSESNHDSQLQRLFKIRDCVSGIEIAEYDYETRGSGDIFGTEQTGQGDFDFIDTDMLNFGKKLVNEIDIENIKNILQGELLRHDLESISFT